MKLRTKLPCGTISNARTRKAPRPSRYDPTRTATLRKGFLQEIRRRFARLRSRVYDLIFKEDALGLRVGNGGFAELMKPPSLAKLALRNAQPVLNQRWRFLSDPEKLKAFQVWLKAQIQSEVLGQDENALWERYIQEGFAKGAGRAFDDTNLKRFSPGGGEFYEGSRAQFLRDSFGRPETVEKVKLLAGRSFSDLEGVTEQMSKVMTRTLTDGLVQGKNPLEIGRNLASAVDRIGRDRAETIARTEIIRAHAEGQLTAFELLGVEELGVAVEWSTTGDDAVCPLCEPLEGVVLKIDEARGMLPRHPNCRCSFIPANVGEDGEGQKDTKSSIDRALSKSQRDEGGGWGPGQAISRSRPEALLNFSRALQNAFCPTGEGGGIDPSCSLSSGPTARTGLAELRTERDAAKRAVREAKSGGEDRGPTEKRYQETLAKLERRRDQVTERKEAIARANRTAEQFARKASDLRSNLPDADNRQTPTVLRGASLARLKSLPSQLLDAPNADKARHYERVRSLAVKAAASIAGTDTSRLSQADRRWVAETVRDTRRIGLAATKAVKHFKNAASLARAPLEG